MAEFKYEDARDTATQEYLVQCALGLYDAGAHLLQVREDKSPGRKASWKEHALTRAEVEACVSQQIPIGIKSPGYDIGISCLDSDRGVQFVDEAANILGKPPLVVHESSRKSEGKCHAWFCTPNPVTARFWEGGEIFSAHTSYVVLHNIPAVWAAYRMASANHRELAVDLNLIVTRKHRPTTAESIDPVEGMTAIGDYGDVPTENRHDTAVRKIARAVETSQTKGEMQEKLALVINAHKKAMANEQDRARRAGVRAEVHNFKVFAEGSWAKKRARNNYEGEIHGLLQTNTPPERFEELLQTLSDRFRDECVKNNWPTPETCEGDLQACFDHYRTKMAARSLFMASAKKAQSEQTEALNEEAARTFEESGDGVFTVESPWGTIESWQEAASRIRVKFRRNSFVDRGQVWIPGQILPRDERGRQRKDGGQWMDMTDSLMAVIVGAIERHAIAPVEGSKAGECKRVYLGRHKSREAREDLFARNTYCPMQDYFDGLPQWDGVKRIHESMERGGMKIDAGPFTGAVQSFVWLFVIRNTMLPGSSMREYIVLHGEHDSGKSKFVELALPYHLREYWNGAFSLAGSLKQKLERSKGKALMECSEMGTGGKKNWDEVKQWLTLSEVNGERMAYKEFIKREKLTATTVFTTNNAELPPTDDAAISRFVWANVITPATRKTDPATGKELRIIWHHFDEFVDPLQPHIGTFREQYFAEAKHTVRQYANKVQWKERGDDQSEWRSNIPWLPEGYKQELVKWNRSAGAVFTTDQSRLIEDIDAAIKLLASYYEVVPGEDNGFFPNMEIKTAINSIRDECKFESWWEVQNAPNTATRDQKIRDIKSVATDTQFANAVDQWAKNNGLDVRRLSQRWSGAGDSKVRGVVFSFKNKDLG